MLAAAQDVLGQRAGTSGVGGEVCGFLLSSAHRGTVNHGRTPSVFHNVQIDYFSPSVLPEIYESQSTLFAADNFWKPNVIKTTDTSIARYNYLSTPYYPSPCLYTPPHPNYDTLVRTINITCYAIFEPNYRLYYRIPYSPNSHSILVPSHLHTLSSQKTTQIYTRTKCHVS